MPPAWFNAHPTRQQQAPPPPPPGERFHPSTAGQRMPPDAGVNGGAHSPHTYHHHQQQQQQRSSPPPMRGQYAGGRYPVQQHPQQSRGPPPPMPPTNAGAGPNHHPHHHHQHNMAAAARHHAASPGMPPRRMPLPPPNTMRPIAQQPGGGPPRAAPFEQQQRAMQQQQAGPSRAMQQHMMRLQQEHHHQQQHHQMQQPRGNGFHPHAAPSAGGPPSSSSSENHNNNMNADPEHQNRMQPPGTPGHATSRSPSPSIPPPPPPPRFQQQQQQCVEHASQQRASPASSLPGCESVDATRLAAECDRQQQQPQPAKPPLSWNAGPGPLRESRLQNMPQKRMMMPMQHPPPMHAQRPHPHHQPNGSSMVNQHQHPYINENMDRFRAMEQQKHMGPSQHHHHVKSMYHRQQQQQMMMHHHQQQQQQRVNAMQSPPGHHQQQQPPPPPPPPPTQEDLQQMQKKQQATGKKGPDVTMDAASMLLALRTSASPSTVSAATLEEQASKDQSETETSKKMNARDQQDHDGYLDDDDVPTLASSSSSLSVPSNKPPCPPVEHHEVPKNFPTRLALPNDEAKLNSLHCFLRSELLEIFVVERSANRSPTHSPGSSVGRVGLRCVFCAMARKRHAVSTTAEQDTASKAHAANLNRCDEAPMAVFYPKSIAEIYRLVTSWQRCHLRKCRSLPPDVRSKWTLLRENDKSRGKTHYWITSAKDIGLMDCQSRAGGIRFVSPRRSFSTSSVANGGLAATSSADDSVGGGLYCVSHSEDMSYQPYNNAHFMDGPSQKQREAAARNVSAPAMSIVESPLKNTNTAEGKAITTPTTSHKLSTPIGV